MPGKRYGIYESIGSGREAVIDYDDLSNHHPSKHFHEKGRVYETVDGRKEEVVLRDGHTLVSKDFVLYDSTGVKKLSDISVAAKQVPVPAPFSGVVEVNNSQALVIIRDAKTGEPLAQIRHMDPIRFQTGDTVEYGQALGTQSNQKTGAVHTHMDINVRYTRPFDQYLKDIVSGAITTEGHPPVQSAHEGNDGIEAGTSVGQGTQARQEHDPSGARVGSNAATATQLAHAQRLKDQLGPRLSQLGMSELQMDALAAAAAKEQTRFSGQGEVRDFLLSKDGSSVAMRQTHPPLRELSVEQALGQSPHAHWREAVLLNGRQQGVEERALPKPAVPEAPALELSARAA